jgi:putative transposase
MGGMRRSALCVAAEVLEMGPSGSDPEAGGKLLRVLAEHHAFENEEMKIAVDDVHVFLGFPPRYSIANVVNTVKCASARTIFCGYVNASKDRGEGEFVKDGHSARTTGDGVPAERIEWYLRHHEDRKATQLKV